MPTYECGNCYQFSKLKDSGKKYMDICPICGYMCWMYRRKPRWYE